jgi:hypothetical protein
MNKTELETNEISFTKFWEVYPRKQKRKKAFTTWTKLKLYKLVDMLIEDVHDRIKHDHQWQDKQYIPLPTSYMNGELWEDEVIVKSIKQDSRVDVMTLGKQKNILPNRGETMAEYERRVNKTR